MGIHIVMLNEIFTPFKLENLEFIISHINIYKKIDTEKEVLNVFRGLGFDNIKIDKRVSGMPDFLFYKKGVGSLYVEVKSNGDGLRDTQVKWIKDNPDKKVLVYYLVQNQIEKEHKKYIKKKIREKEKEEERLKKKKELSLKASEILDDF